MERSDKDWVEVSTSTDLNPNHPDDRKSRRLSWLFLFGVALLIGAAIAIVVRESALVRPSSTERSGVFEDAVRFTVVVQVSNDEDVCWSGSGFVVGDGTYVVTNAHVAPGNYGKPPYITDAPPDPTCTQLEVGFIDSIREYETKWYDATIVEARETLDLSLLKITNPPRDGFPTAVLDPNAPLLGSAIRVLGYPDFALDSMVLTDGIIAGFEERDYGYLYTITAKIGHGNSGGPVMSLDGRVIGVLTLGGPQTFLCVPESEDRTELLDCSVERTSLGYAIPIGLAQPLLDLIKSE